MGNVTVQSRPGLLSSPPRIRHHCANANKSSAWKEYVLSLKTVTDSTQMSVNNGHVLITNLHWFGGEKVHGELQTLCPKFHWTCWVRVHQADCGCLKLFLAMHIRNNGTEVCLTCSTKSSRLQLYNTEPWHPFRYTIHSFRHLLRPKGSLIWRYRKLANWTDSSVIMVQYFYW